jgi:two-component system phosphate regulon response regulator PhoB
VISLLKFNLQKAGYNLLISDNGPAAVTLANENRPDAIILDLNLPGMSGFEVCKALRSDNTTEGIPVIMLTARGQPRDRIEGLEHGADDYVTKPFSPKELLLRLKAILRRTRATPPSVVEEFDAFRLDRAQMEIRIDGDRMELTNTEYKLLATLMENRGRILSREILLSDVWGYKNTIDTRTVDTHMRRLREKLGKYSDRIETVRGYGYRFNVVNAK